MKPRVSRVAFVPLVLFLLTHGANAAPPSTSTSSSSGGSSLPPCVITGTDPGPIDDIDLDAAADCEDAGVPLLQFRSLPAPALETQSVGKAGYSYVGVYSDESVDAQANGVSARLSVTNPAVPHGSYVCTDPRAGETTDFVAHRLMVRWLDDPNGLDIYHRYTWIEIGWTESANYPDQRNIYSATNITTRLPTYDSRTHTGFALTDGVQIPFLIKRSSGSDKWRAQIYWQGSWKLLRQVVRNASATRVEVFSETNNGCSEENIAPGTSRHGNTNLSRQPIRIKDASFEWKLWDPINYPAVASGGFTRTSSQRLCPGASTVCEQATWTQSWYDFTTAAP